VTATIVIARNANEAMVAPMVASAESGTNGSLESGGPFCFGAFDKNLVPAAVEIPNIWDTKRNLPTNRTVMLIELVRILQSSPIFGNWYC
jgi:hypothetical protein